MGNKPNDSTTTNNSNTTNNSTATNTDSFALPSNDTSGNTNNPNDNTMNNSPRNMDGISSNLDPTVMMQAMQIIQSSEDGTITDSIKDELLNLGLTEEDITQL